jgi:hypothetical protein
MSQTSPNRRDWTRTGRCARLDATQHMSFEFDPSMLW